MYRSERLPHDAFSLVPLPLPVGGALVVCANMVLHVNQGFSCGLALNDFGDKQVRAVCVCALTRIENMRGSLSVYVYTNFTRSFKQFNVSCCIEICMCLLSSGFNVFVAPSI